MSPQGGGVPVQSQDPPGPVPPHVIPLGQFPVQPGLLKHHSVPVVTVEQVVDVTKVGLLDDVDDGVVAVVVVEEPQLHTPGLPCGP
jgi:hypothetical protein